MADFPAARRAMRFVWLGLLVASALAPRMEADFVSPYALSDFTLVNSANADGSVTTPDGGRTVVLTGPNDGSGLPGYTELAIVAKASGQFRFSYTYTSLDIAGADSAGYLVNDHVFSLASSTGASGKTVINVRAGDRIGFRIDTTDNTGEPGVLTISSFDTPARAIPASSAGSLFALALLLSSSGLLFMTRRRRA